MITGVTTDTAAATAAMKQSTGLSKDDFLQLFITQLQNQDPLNPQDSSEFIGQMAQLTQVEQAYNTNTNLASIIDQLNGATSFSSVAYIGKTVTANGDQIQLAAGAQPTIGYRLDANAGKVAIDITDNTGTVVRTLTLGNTPAGDGTIVWDGKDGRGVTLPAGEYAFSVTGYNADGEKFQGYPHLVGTVQGVTLEGEEPYVTIGGVNVPLSNVLSVKGA